MAFYRFTSAFCFFLLLFFTTNSTQGQGYNFNIQFEGGNPGGLNTESDTSTLGWVGLNVGGESVNTWSANQLMPFPFFFYGAPVSAFKVSLNGLITFSTTSSLLPNANLNLPTSAIPNQTIACFWDEFSASPPLSSDSRILTKLIGTVAGSRQLWIKWNLFEIGNPSVSFSNFACVLEEGSNKVYIVDMNYASANVSATIGLQNTNTNAFQFGSNFAFFFSTTAGPSPANNDFYEFTPQQTNDIGIQAITSPSVPLGSGNNPVRVTLRNFSSSTLTSAIIKWNVNGVPQPDFNWTGSVAANSALPNVEIGNFNFLSGITYTIQAYTQSPNGGSDINPTNDTATLSNLCPLFSGSFTVGGVGADFTTLQQALDALSCSGIESPVTLNLNASAGPYPAFVLTNFLGQSSVNTLTIDGGSAKAVITSSGATTIRLDGADNVILRNLEIVNTGTANSFAVQLINNANDNRVEDCRIQAISTTSAFNGNAGIGVGTSFGSATGGNNAARLSILRNEFTGGTAAVAINSINFTSTNPDILITENIITAVTLFGVQSFNSNRLKIQKNSITLTGNSSAAKAINLTGDEGFEITGNTIRFVVGDGIDLNNCNNTTGSASNRALIANNFIISNGTSTFAEGLEISSTSFVDFIHNSVAITGSNSDVINFQTFGSPSNFVRILNNSLALFNTTSTFVRVVDISTFGTLSNFFLDHNNYFISGASNGLVRGPFGDFTEVNVIGGGGFNFNSRVGNPGYLDPASDLHAITGQLSNGGDNAVSTPFDIDGDPRPFLTGGVVDIGADEFDQVPNDVGITRIVSPRINGRALTSSGFSASQSIIVNIANFGTSPQFSIPVFLVVNGNTTGPFVFSGTLAPGANQNFTIPAAANMLAAGTYEIFAYTNLPNDGINTNDTSVSTFVDQLANAPQVFPFFEDFEGVPNIQIQNDSTRGIAGATKFDYLPLGLNPRLRSQAGVGFAQSGSKAITFDRGVFGSTLEITQNNLVLTMNMSGYSTSDIILLDFSYMNHGVFTDQPNNRVFIRGNDTAPWIQIFNLFSNQNISGTYRNVVDINLSTALAAASQSYSSSFQIRFGHQGTSQVNFPTSGSGYTFDNIGVRRILQRDIAVGDLLEPFAQQCGDSSQVVRAVIKNLGILAQTNIPITAEISGSINATLNTTFSGTLAPGDSAVVNLGVINSSIGGTSEFKIYTAAIIDEDRGNDTLTRSVLINTRPLPPVLSNQLICGGESATFSLPSGVSEYRWFAAATDPTPLFTSGTTFTTPTLTDTTTYFVSSATFTKDRIGIPNNLTPGGPFNFYTAGLVFDVERPVIIDSLFVYPTTTGNVSVLIRDNLGNVVASRTFNITVAGVRTLLPLNIRLDAGQDYRISAEGTTVTALFRSTGGVNYPYSIPNVLSIKSAFPTSSFIYYFFYDWHLTIEGCESSRVPVTINVTPSPTVDLGPDVTVCLPVGDSVVLDAGNTGLGFGFLWNVPGETTNILSVKTTGSYNVAVSNPLTGCVGRDTALVIINTPPIVNLGPDTTRCGGSVLLNAGNPGFNYLWSPGNQTSQTINATTSGTYIVRVTNPVTSCFAFDTVVVTINPLPIVNLGNDTTQCSGSVTLNAGNPGFNYLWSPGNQTDQSITTSTSGTFSVRVTNPATGCVNRDTIVVTIHPLPVVNLGPDVTQCAGSVTLNAGNPGFNYLWSPGNQTSQSINVTTSGTYIARVTNPVTGCFAFDTVVVTIHPLPTVSIAGNDNICLGDSSQISIVLPSGSFDVSYFNGTDTSTLSGVGGSIFISVTPTASTTYTLVSVTNNATGCFINAPSPNLTGTAVVNVLPLPVATLSGIDTICFGDSAAITFGLSSGLYTVEFTDGVSSFFRNGVSNSDQFFFSPLSSVSFTLVSVVNESSLCSVQAPSPNLSGSASIVVNDLPTAIVDYGSGSFCATDSIVPLIQGTVGGTFSAFPSGLNINASNGSIDLNSSSPNQYFITYQFNDTNGCSNSTEDTLIVLPLPEPDLGPDTISCGPILLEAGLSASNKSFNWNNGLGSDSTFVADSTGLYLVSVTDIISGCVGTDTVEVTIQPVPVVDFGNDTIVCALPLFIQANVSGNDLSLVWNTALGAQDTVSILSPGTVRLTVTDTLTGCSQTDSIIVGFEPISVNLGPDTTVCDSLVLLPNIVGNGPFTFVWNDTLSTTNQLTVVSSSSYSVVVSNVFGCSATDTTFVTVNTTPRAPAWSDTSICLGSSLVLNALTAGATNYQWSTGDSTSSITVMEGFYSVVVSTLGCFDTASIVISYTDTVTANFSFTIGGLFGDSVSFISLADSTFNHFWDFGNGQTSTAINPSVLYDTSGIYQVTLVVSDPCDIDSITQSVTIIITGILSGLAQTEILLYPNPSEGAFKLSWDNRLKPSEVVVYDLTLKPVWTRKLYLEDWQQAAVQVDMKEFASGMYVVELQSEVGVSRIKWIKQ